MKTILLLLKFVSVLTGLSAYADLIPAKYLPIAVLVFAVASTIKDLLLKIGDWLDDKKLNNSFNPDPPLQVLFALLAASFLFTGCSSLDPGARAVVVRAEQSIVIANVTFDAAVHIDDSNRPFFRTNAPAFHQFAEWLRTPVVMVPLTNSLPRGLAIVSSADAVKNRYKATNSTNDYASLISSLAVVESVTGEAQKFIAETTTRK